MCMAAALAFLKNFRIPDTAFNWPFSISFLCINNQNRSELLLHVCAQWGSKAPTLLMMGMEDVISTLSSNLPEKREDFLFPRSNRKPFKVSDPQ